MKTLVDNPKPPIQLFREKKSELGGLFEPLVTQSGQEVWACGECGILYAHQYGECDQKQKASDCCRQRYCQCGKKMPDYWLKCSECSHSATNSKRLEEATEVTDFDGPVYDPDRDEYHESVEMFLDWVSDRQHDGFDEDEIGIPEFLHPCNIRPFARLDASDVIQHELDDHYEDATDAVEDLDGLQKALDEWVDKQTLKSWNPDYRRKINVAKLLEDNK